MKRIGALAGFTMLAVLLSAYYMGKCVALYGMIALILCFPFCIFIRKIRTHRAVIFILITAMLALTVYFYYTEFIFEKSHYYAEKSANITGIVDEEPYKRYNTFCYKIKTQMIGDDSTSTFLLLRSDFSLDVTVGEEISFRATPKIITSDYYKTKGVFLSCDTDKNFTYNVISHGNDFRYFPQRLSHCLKEIVENYMNDDTSAVCNAMTFGSNADVPYEISHSFRKAGIAHIIVVSGLHTAVICSVAGGLFGLLFGKRKISSLLTIIFVLFFMMMTGMSYSVIRSGIMVIILMIVRMINRDADSLNSLGIAIFVLALIQPYSVADTGLLLSISATAGIVTMAQPLTNFIVSRLNVHSIVIKSLTAFWSVYAAATLAITPINIIVFGYFSMFSFFSNLLVMPILELTLILILTGTVTTLAGAVKFGEPFLYVGNILNEYIIQVAKSIANIRHSTVSTNRVYIWLWIFMTFILAFLVYLVKNYNKTVPITVVSSILILITGSVGDFLSCYNKTFLKVYNTGCGVTATVSRNNNAVVLASGGDKKFVKETVIEKLEQSADDFTVMSVTDSHSDMSMYAEPILSELGVDNLFIFGQNPFDEYDGEVCSFDDDYSIFVNDFHIEYINHSGTIYTYLTADDKTLLILPDSADCSVLSEKYRTPDIVIAHSGIKNGNLLNCRLLIMCCTEEKYASCMQNIGLHFDEIYTTYNGDFVSEMEIW
ncbi:MAG: ComEC/Rec2 family competence protein [Ruminococcus sp.]|nr:ComEC/Rec2 family competence protein [Ruminococcus sp.]